ncbi:Serine/threonine-protein phosphatase 2A regulatory subunit B'' subunit beta [Apophysomyces ossiformis]|uniref:Serine/threonine-protein phosphatase 2A regulatory subunit B'' subunit beta n=1 Tax=Apophysomyces ossiformis TaxID=679940 RepID=A0A8H7BZZ8_9FUNG|nr:Serine/threonine-protein phosphatase 2A regulatory subunit B'' subunit beta [Apophysomyces ossiformis]
MSKFTEFRQHAENAIAECTKAASSYRQSKNVNEAPDSVVKSFVQTHIAPLAGPDNTINVPLLEGKPDWRKHALEHIFRRTLLGVLDRCPEQDAKRFEQLFDILDLVLTSSESDYLDTVIPLTLIEELFDVHTIAGCELLFNYVEKRKGRLTVNMVPTRGKGLVLLRMCNEMLRRLSKEKNTVFCGRILMFLANSFPLGDRSDYPHLGVNLRGDFNSEPVQFDSEEDVDADPTMTDEQKKFYKLFWSIRKYFSNPRSIFDGSNFDEFKKGGDAILEKFQQIAERDQAISGASEVVEPMPGKKRRYDENHVDGNADAIEQMLREINSDYQFPRLLSSRKLLELEIDDPRFRRNVIVQFLILFQYLSGFTQDEKEQTQALLAARGATKQSLVQPTFTLTDEQIIWKASGCPDFEKPPLDIEALTSLWKSKKPRLTAPPPRYRYTYGNKDLTDLYGTPRETLSDIMVSRAAIPTALKVIDDALQVLEDSLDPPETRFDIANGALFHATRLMFKSHAHLIPKVYNVKKDAYKEMKDSEKDRVKPLFDKHERMTETDFVAVSQACPLPRYMNSALFKRLTAHDEITFEEFASGWKELTRNRFDDHSLYFNILKKAGSSYLSPEDFLPVLEVETVICRLYYDARCPSGKMTFSQFKRCRFTEIINRLGPDVEVSNTDDCFSYKHFYVLYCKFWTLDCDHDLVISEYDLARYDHTAMAPRIIHRVMQCGRIWACSQEHYDEPLTLTYLDYIWFLLSEVDKTTPMAIEYWYLTGVGCRFRCMDTDGDGVLSSYELSQFWEEQEKRQIFYGIAEDDRIRFEDVICQMNDLIQPTTPGQFLLHDLKQNGYIAERFFDTFVNFDRFQLHESYQGSLRAKHYKRRAAGLNDALEEAATYYILSDWCEYAELEYQQLQRSEGQCITWDEEEENSEQDVETEQRTMYLQQKEEDEEEQEREEEEEEKDVARKETIISQDEKQSQEETVEKEKVKEKAGTKQVKEQQEQEQEDEDGDEEKDKEDNVTQKQDLDCSKDIDNMYHDIPQRLPIVCEHA